MTANLPTAVARPSDDTERGPRRAQRPLVALVVPAGSYRTADFITAARGLRVDVVVASDSDVPVSDVGRSRMLSIDFDRPEWSAARIAGLAESPDAVVAADDRGVIIAAMASQFLGLTSNPVSSVAMTRDKAHMRGLLASAGIPQPRFTLAGDGEVPGRTEEIGYPCVVKPRSLSASLGVIRVDSDSEAQMAEGRIRRIIADQGGDASATLLVEEFIPGFEVAVEGLVSDGEFRVLAILDKPDPLDGPFFEETIFVTPSRLTGTVQQQITEVVRSAVEALGLATGPIHAEVRIGSDGPFVIEVAARSIGGLCGRALTFGLLGESLESLILRSALGLVGADSQVAASATGVMMVPIPGSGTLVSVSGVDDALAVAGVTSIDQTMPVGRPVVPLPEGDRYLGFIFAEAETPDEVESALRTAHAALTITIT